MKQIVVNGEQCRLDRMEERDARPGCIVRELGGRRVYRVVCTDGDELILRNVRHDDLLISVPLTSIAAEYGLVSALP